MTVGGGRCVQENIVRYDDEGGGEQDTQAFDLLALRHPHTTGQSQARTLAPGAEPASGSNRPLLPFIRERLQQAELDSAAPPFDSLHTYAFEGSASSAASLSSLNSPDSFDSQERQQNADLLKEWGPGFQKLADLYGLREGGGWPCSPQSTPVEGRQAPVLPHAPVDNQE